MSARQGWLARLREAFVEQGVFSLKPLPRTRAEAELACDTPQPPGDLTSLGLTPTAGDAKSPVTGARIGSSDSV